MRTAGIILDIYDDPQGRVLREAFADAAMPEKLSSSELLRTEDLNALPDRLFALVATDHNEVIRKYAMHDQPHLATSIVYFLECGSVLPDETRAKVASNLIGACDWYDMEPPHALVKEALNPLGVAAAGMDAMTLGDKARQGSDRKRMQMQQFRQAQVAGTTPGKYAGMTVEIPLSEDRRIQAGGGTPGHVEKALGRMLPRDKVWAKLMDQIEGHNDQPQPHPSGDSTKRADLTGSEAMPRGTLKRPVRGNTEKTTAMPAKTSAAALADRVPRGWQSAGDLTHAETPIREKRAEYEHFALPHLERYPLDTPELVKAASDYFDEHEQAFPLLERRIFAESLWQRAEDLGVEVEGAFAKYAGSEYGPYLEAELLARARGFEGTGHEAVYETLLEKKAQIDPPVMAQLLKEADEATGAASTYGRPGVGYRNPYEAVYGKTAAEQDDKLTEDEVYSWVGGNDYTNAWRLRALAEAPRGLDGAFDEDFIKSFRKDPVGIFKSLPDPQKVTIARLAANNSGSTFRI